MTTTTTFTTTCGAARNITGCARAIHHDGGHTTSDEIAHYGSDYAADTAINGTGTSHIVAIVAAALTGIIH